MGSRPEARSPRSGIGGCSLGRHVTTCPRPKAALACLSVGLLRLPVLSSLRICVVALALLLPTLCSAEETPEPPADAEATVLESPVADLSTVERGRTQDATVPAVASAHEVEVPEPGVARPSVARVGLVELLDLVPVGDSSFFAVRDPQAAADYMRGLITGIDPDAIGMAGLESGPAKGDETLEVFESVFSALGDGDLDLGRGVLFLETPDGDAVVYASSSGNPVALREALQAEGSTETSIPEFCVEPPKMRGYMACGANRSALLGLEAGDRGAALMALLADALPRVSVESHNIVGSHRHPKYGDVLFAIETTPNQLRGAIGMGVGEAADQFVVGPAPAIELLAPAGPLFWVQAGRSLREGFGGGLSPETRAWGASHSGEMTVSVLPGGALAFLMGVEDPAPGAALVTFMGLALDKVREALPGEPEVTIESIEASESSFQALRARYERGPWAEAAARFGIPPHLWAFVAGKHAGVVFGGEPRTLAKVADGVGGMFGASWRPAELMRDLRGGACAVAAHVPLDSLQAPTERERILGLARKFRSLDPADVEALHTGLDMLASLSSVSLWLTEPATTPVIHLVVENFGDVETEEGKDALAALERIRAGAPPASEYRALASKYGASPRAARYRQRAGETSQGRTLALLTGLAFGQTSSVDSLRGKRRRSRAKSKPPGRSRPRSGGRRPISEVKSNAIYSPGPDARALKAARVGAATTGKGAVSFCVSSSGKVERVKTAKRIKGGKEPGVDQLLRDTVKKWRFSPFMEAGRPTPVCTKAEFNLRFD